MCVILKAQMDSLKPSADLDEAKLEWQYIHDGLEELDRIKKHLFDTFKDYYMAELMLFIIMSVLMFLFRIVGKGCSYLRDKENHEIETGYSTNCALILFCCA